MLWVEAPTVENAIVLPSASFSDLIGLSAFTYQKRSAAPVISEPITRTGAPFENAPRMLSVPSEMPTSMLLAISACCVSPEPCVHSTSSRGRAS